MSEATPATQAVEIPLEMISAEALEGIIDNFILREGTDYGANEVSMERKREQIRNQLESKKIVIVFDAASESVTLLTAQDWNHLRTSAEAP